MEANNIDDPCCEATLSSSSGVEHCVGDLLEECWFFGNLLVNPKPEKTNNTFTRCYSDPCPSSSTIKLPNIAVRARREGQEGLVVVVHEGERDHKVMKQKPRDDCVDKKEGNTRKVLTRTQTLPTCMRNVEMSEEGESDSGKMSKSGRGASLNLVHILPPRHDKGSSRYRPPRSTELEGIITNTDGSKDMRRRYLNGRTLRRSTSELEIEEVQGFKDLGFTFDNKDSLSPSVVNILPGLQHRSEEDLGQESKVQRPYLSEAWLVQCCGPPLPPPNWASSRSSEDVKAQIKFWARSVASNVRLEC